MEEAPAAAVEEGLPDDTRDAATSPMPSTSMPPLVQESSSESDDDDEMPPLEDGEIRYVSQRDEEDDGLVVDVRHSLGRLTRLSARMRSLRDQAIWQREATTTVTELLAAAADLESLAEERMRLLRTVTALRRKPKRHVPENFLEKLPDVVLNDQNREEPCPICLCRLDGKDAEATQPGRPHRRLPFSCR